MFGLHINNNRTDRHTSGVGVKWGATTEAEVPTGKLPGAVHLVGKSSSFEPAGEARATDCSLVGVGRTRP